MLAVALVVYHFCVVLNLMPGCRKCYSIHWTEMTAAQKRRVYRDAWYRTPHSGPNKAFVECSRSAATPLRAMARAYETHVRRDAQTGCAHHYGRLATLAALRTGVISNDTAKADFREYKLGNKAKHDTTLKRKAWADIRDDDDGPSMPPDESDEVFFECESDDLALHDVCYGSETILPTMQKLQLDVLIPDITRAHTAKLISSLRAGFLEVLSDTSRSMEQMEGIIAICNDKVSCLEESGKVKDGMIGDLEKKLALLSKTTLTDAPSTTASTVLAEGQKKVFAKMVETIKAKDDEAALLRGNIEKLQSELTESRDRINGIAAEAVAQLMEAKEFTTEMLTKQVVKDFQAMERLLRQARAQLGTQDRSETHEVDSITYVLNQLPIHCKQVVSETSRRMTDADLVSDWHEPREAQKKSRRQAGRTGKMFEQADRNRRSLDCTHLMVEEHGTSRFSKASSSVGLFKNPDEAEFANSCLPDSLQDQTKMSSPWDSCHEPASANLHDSNDTSMTQ